MSSVTGRYTSPRSRPRPSGRMSTGPFTSAPPSTVSARSLAETSPSEQVCQPSETCRARYLRSASLHYSPLLPDVVDVLLVFYGGRGDEDLASDACACVSTDDGLMLTDLIATSGLRTVRWNFLLAHVYAFISYRIIISELNNGAVSPSLAQQNLKDNGITRYWNRNLVFHWKKML